MAPLVLDLLFAALLLLQLDALLRQNAVPPKLAAAALLAVVLLTPLVPLVFTGLEHPLHAILTVACLQLAGRVIARDPAAAPATRDDRWLLGLVPLSVMARFEALFLVGVIALLLAARGRVRLATLLGAAAFLPVVAYGIVSLAQGWFFLPNSVLVKGSSPELSARGLLRFLLGFGPEGPIGVQALFVQRHLLVLVVAAAAVLFARWRRRRRYEAPDAMLVIWLATTMLHLQFARTGHFYRYESYLVIAGIFVLALAAPVLLPARPPLRPRSRAAPVLLAATALGALLLAPLVSRAARACRETPIAIGNIHQQQYQMGRFLAAHYPGRGVVANDIGAITWLADFRLLDIAALASVEVADARRKNAISAELLERLAGEQRMDIGVAYENWLPWNRLPAKWTRVGQWTIPDNVICAESTVLFFAVDPTQAETLARRLAEFAPSLPAAVTSTVF